MLRPVTTRRTFEEAIDQIVELIRLGDLGAGDRLPSEREMAAQMEISRPTVREAIRLLAEAGVVQVRPGAAGGAFVQSEYVPRDLVAQRSEMRMGEVGGVLEARRMLEPQVAQLAATHATDEDFDALQRTIDRQRALMGDAELRSDLEDPFLQLDMQFHLGIARATRNRTVLKLMRSLLRELEIARDMALHEANTDRWAIDIHDRTLEAIRARDLELIDEVMDEHLGRLERLWERESGSSLIRPVPTFLRPVAARVRR